MERKWKLYDRETSCLNPLSFLCWTFVTYQNKFLARKKWSGQRNQLFSLNRTPQYISQIKTKPALPVCTLLMAEHSECRERKWKRTMQTYRTKEMCCFQLIEKRDSPLHHYHVEKDQVIFWNSNQCLRIDWKVLQWSDQHRATEASAPEQGLETEDPKHTQLFLLLIINILPSADHGSHIGIWL